VNCENRKISIEQLLDGELPQRVRQDLETHLKDCHSCHLFLEQLEQEQNTYKKYLSERTMPSVVPHLWDSIEQQLASSSRSVSRRQVTGHWWDWMKSSISMPRWSPLAAVLLLLVSIGLSFRYLRPGLDNAPQKVEMARLEKGNVPEAVTGRPAPTGSSLQRPREVDSLAQPSPKTSSTLQPARHPSKKQLTPRQLIQQAEENYRAAVALLEKDFKHRPNPLDENTRAQFQAALATIDQTIEQTRAAVRLHPEDPQTVQYMLIAYAKKVELLEEMVSF
jgi:hypothetical protein